MANQARLSPSSRVIAEGALIGEFSTSISSSELYAAKSETSKTAARGGVGRVAMSRAIT